MAMVGMLRVAPVKGLASVTREQVFIDSAGVAEDRRVFLLDPEGSVVTLRRHSTLMQATPDLDLEAGVLRVTLPDGTTAESALDQIGESRQGHLYGKDRTGHVLPGDVAEALSTLAGMPITVVVADQTGIGWDEGPVSILGRSSAEAVGGTDRDRARYRMLIELEGTEAYEEDTWLGRSVAIDDAVVRVSHPLVRCRIITLSPATGEKDWDGLNILESLRGPDLCLGVIAEVVTPGSVRVGASVELLDSPAS